MSKGPTSRAFRRLRACPDADVRMDGGMFTGVDADRVASRLAELLDSGLPDEGGVAGFVGLIRRLGFCISAGMYHFCGILLVLPACYNSFVKRSGSCFLKIYVLSRVHERHRS